MVAVKKLEKVCAQCKQKREIQYNRQICNACRSLNQKVNIGEARPPEFSEVNTRAYKEPMEKVEKGFGFYGAVTQTNDGKHIQCHVCGYFFENLSSHIVLKHKIKAVAYKIKYGLRLKEGLLSPIYKMQAQARYNAVARKTPAEYREMSRKAKIARAEKGVKTGGNMWSKQGRNERGNCKAQTLAKIKMVAERNGGVVTQPLLEKAYGQGVLYSVRHWFGSWKKALIEADIKDYFAQKDDLREKTREIIKEKFMQFYKETGRTPQWSDLETYDELPSAHSVQYLFPNINVARLEAGIPLLVYKGHKWIEVPVEEADEWMLTGRAVAK